MAVGSARAGALTEFPNLPGSQPSNLLGYLARPDGPGPFPAVVGLHGCMGISSHSIAIADRLKALGYVALAVDSLRGIADQCGRFFLGQATDAYAALRFLYQLPFVDANRIALLGQSMGGSSALMDVERGSIEQRYSERFIAAIAYYPACRGHSATLIAPTLILIGEEDEVNPAQACREMAALPHGDGANLDLMVYPGVHHAFDVDWFQPGRRVNGRWFEYNEPAASDAWDRVRAFLSTNRRHSAAGDRDQVATASASGPRDSDLSPLGRRR